MMRRLRIGETLEGRYRVEKLLASGGQAHVYRASHLVLSRPVAIKLLKPGMSPEVAARMTKRFEQEARLISALRDPHTITLYDFGRLDEQGGALFMIFEFIDGLSLKEILRSVGPLAPHRVAKILRQTLSSLQEAHSFGVLHRDLKPANIMLYEHAGRTDQVKLLDFGIAKILRESDDFTQEALTGVNNMVGTPRYISPESYDSELEMGPAADLYSLGLVAYELLVGEPANKGSTPIDVFRNHLSPHSVKLPAQLHVPAGLRAVIDKMLEKTLDRRYATAEQVLWELRFWHSDERTSSGNWRTSHDARAFDPEDIDIPDPYADVAPTQAISGEVLREIGHQDSQPLRAEPSSGSFQPSRQRGRARQETPNPEVFATAERLQQDDAPTEVRPGIVSIIRAQDVPDRGGGEPSRELEHETSSNLGVETQILSNVPNIDDILLGVPGDLEPEGALSEAEDLDAFGPCDDDTMNVNLEEALAEDASLASASGVEEGERRDEYLAPDDKTARLDVFPPLKKAAVLKRRPRRRHRVDVSSADDKKR